MKKKRKICGSEKILNCLLSHYWNLKLSSLLFSLQTQRLYNFPRLYFLKNQKRKNLMMKKLLLFMKNSSLNPQRLNRILNWHMMIYFIIHAKMNSIKTGLKVSWLKKVETTQLFVSFHVLNVLVQWLIKDKYWKMKGSLVITLQKLHQFRMLSLINLRLQWIHSINRSLQTKNLRWSCLKEGAKNVMNKLPHMTLKERRFTSEMLSLIL